MIFSVLLSMFGLACFVSLVFRLAVFAFPIFMGLSAGILLHDHGAGLTPAVVLGLMIGTLAFLIGQWAFAAVQSLFLRLLIVFLFSIPAGLAGYFIVIAISELGGTSNGWTQLFGFTSGVVVAGTAYERLENRFDW